MYLTQGISQTYFFKKSDNFLVMFSLQKDCFPYKRTAWIFSAWSVPKLLGAQTRDIPETHLAKDELGDGRRVIKSHTSAELVSQLHKPILVPTHHLIGIVVT